MSFFNSLFRKPLWQSQDLAVRLQAIATDDDPKLIAQLLQLAANDSEPKVRMAAIGRLTQTANLQNLLPNEQTAEVREAIAQRLRQLFRQPQELSVTDRLAWIANETDQKTLEAITTSVCVAPLSLN
jgi:hypothetical protein